MNFLSTDPDYLTDQLINKHVMIVGTKTFQLVELEYYHKSNTHPDGFVHGDQEQLQTGTWYYHRMKGSYKEGTFKGMDITFGPSDQYGGLLVRAIKDLGTNKIIEGPCLVVNAILEEHKLNNVKELANLSDKDTRDVLKNKYHYIKPLDANQYNNAIICKSPRVGLKFNSKMTNTEFQNKLEYILKNYRFHASNCPIKKQAFTINIKDKAANTTMSSSLDEFEKMLITTSHDKSITWNSTFYYNLYQFCKMKNITF
jgi:hypothetical protein